ncbi:hypothetical protein [Planctopirus hydrillae]|uniref:Uncharacterized protein n=1 Tax=Planctopirus hydrillae TaxID=1841610 RepID=A0A1C3E7L4_9PLAN|nr:hypothetical protein [Planctopirus hydrillae]ODA29245.1 hypothetical protein A6X21_09090 [Planctopirus hydrillae]
MNASVQALKEMTAEDLHRSVLEKYAIAKDHDLSRVVDFMVFREKSDEKEVYEAIEEYRKHIAILAVYTPLGYEIPISDDVDPVWHTHVLHTGDYLSLCNKLGCGFIHHQPFVFRAEAEAIMPTYREVTCELHKKHFGLNNKFWGPDKHVGCMNKP